MERRTVVLAGVAVLVVAGLYWLISPRPILVETAKVREEKFIAFVEEDGRTRVRDRYIVSSPLAGRVPRSALRVGDRVKAGQVLATVTPNVSPLVDPRARRELEERVGAAQASVEEAIALKERSQVQLSRARIDLERTTQLKSRGVASVAQFDRDTFAFDSAERELAAAGKRQHAAEHALEVARAALTKSGEFQGAEGFPISSPIEGQVLKIVQESEAVVGLGTPLLEIGNMSDLEIIVDLLTIDAAQVREGAKVLIDRSGLSATLDGQVRRVEPSGFTKVSALGVEEQRVWVIVDIVSPRSQWTSLGDGFRAAIKIVAEEIENATVVPTGALIRQGEDWQVFVVDGNRAALRKVELRRRSGRNAAIARGLRAGEVVIVYPPSTLSPNVKVSVAPVVP